MFMCFMHIYDFSNVEYIDNQSRLNNNYIYIFMNMYVLILGNNLLFFKEKQIYTSN